MKYELRKRNKKAISDAVVVLLLVIAGVIIAILVVGFAFGIFTGSASGAQITVSSAQINNAGKDLTISITNKGSTTFTVPSSISIIYNGQTFTPTSVVGPTSIQPGQTVTVTYKFTSSIFGGGSSGPVGQTVTITINGLSPSGSIPVQASVAS